MSGTTSLPATSLPDPSTFFDTIGPEPTIGLTKPVTTTALTDAMDGLSIKVFENSKNKVPYCKAVSSNAPP